MLKQVRYICAQPAISYYAWQVEVMLNNFRDMGVNLNQVDIVCEKPACKVPEEWTKLAERYPARFFFLLRHSQGEELHIQYPTKHIKTAFCTAS